MNLSSPEILVLEEMVPECYIGLFLTLDTSDIIPPPPLSPSQLLPTQHNIMHQNHTTTMWNMSQNQNNNKPPIENLNDSSFAFIVGPCFALFIMFWNLVLIWGLLNSNNNNNNNSSRNVRLSITKKLFVYHSCTDLIAGVFVVPIQIIMHLGLGYTCWFMSFALALTSFSQCSGVSTLVTVSVLRFYTIKYPTKPVSPTVVLMTLSVQFIFNLAISLHTFFVYFRRSTAYDLSLNFVLSFVYLFTYSIFLVAFNMGSSRLICTHIQNRIRSYQQQNNENHYKAVSTLRMITVCYTVCIVPFICYFLFLGIYLRQKDAKLLEYFNHLKNIMPFHILYLLNCGLTAAIYVTKMGMLRKLFEDLPLFRRVFYRTPLNNVQPIPLNQLSRT